MYPSSIAERFAAMLRSHAHELEHCDGERVLERTFSTAPEDASFDLLRELAIHDAAARTFEAPEYGFLASRLLTGKLREELEQDGIFTFSDSIERAAEEGLIGAGLLKLCRDHSVELNSAIRPGRDYLFSWFGLKTLADRYLLRHPISRRPMESPQMFLLRVAAGTSDTLAEALELYACFSTHRFLPSSPTLFNAGTARPQLSSCFLLDSPKDDLADIYKRYTDIAMLSKYAGGIGVSFSRVRSQGSLIRGTNGQSRGIVPFLKTLDASVAAVNQGGRRKGACCVYLEPWHADVERFLELRDSTGDEAARTHDLNLAHWIPDLFMRRVEADASWSLFDPKDVPALVDTWGPAFDAMYEEAEERGLAIRTLPARELYGRMMRTLAQTGNGWMCFKDAANRTCNQVGEGDAVVHLSNLCTEILEVTDGAQTAVCNLASIHLGRHVGEQGVDWEKLAETVRVAVRQLDRVIDRNLYTIPEAEHSNLRWRPVGLGVMGLADVFYTLRQPFDSEEARATSVKIAEWIYFHAVQASADLALELGPHPTFEQTHAAHGRLQPHLWADDPTASSTWLDWESLRLRVKRTGMRNSLLVAIAPTATIASILGCTECVEPPVSNLFKRETLSGEFLQVNRFLVKDLRALGLWTEEVRAEIKRGRGSIQHLSAIPEQVRRQYRTAWELSMKAVIDLAADRSRFIDQSQSLNLFAESPTIGSLSSMYMYAWKRGLKTTYYLRSRPATQIGMSTLSPSQAALACSLENPSSCEACQ